MIRFLILILVGHLCYGNETNDEKNQISDFLNALRDAKYVSYSKKTLLNFWCSATKRACQKILRKVLVLT